MGKRKGVCMEGVDKETLIMASGYETLALYTQFRMTAQNMTEIFGKARGAEIYNKYLAHRMNFLNFFYYLLPQDRKAICEDILQFAVNYDEAEEFGRMQQRGGFPWLAPNHRITIQTIQQ